MVNSLETRSVDNVTRTSIMEAARQEFFHKGFDGARMQVIANNAGINKALLHYYFQSKQLLFEEIFTEAFADFFPKIAEIIALEKIFFEKIELIVDAYISLMQRRPSLPMFIFREIHKDPDTVFKLVFAAKRNIVPHLIFEMIDEAKMKKVIKPIPTEQLFINIMSLCVFPFLGAPMLQRVTGLKNTQYNQLIEKRKKEVAKFIIDAIKL
jgi:AcrR family transcriptional regulator